MRTRGERKTRRPIPPSHHMFAYAQPPLRTSPDIEPTSTRRTREKVDLPSARPILARDLIPKTFFVACARDSHLQCPSVLLLVCSCVGFFRRRFSRAHPTHVPLGTAHAKGNVRLSSARACEWCGRRGWCVRLSPTSALTAPMHQQQAQAAHLIATVNGRTYTRYALGLCTGL